MIASREVLLQEASRLASLLPWSLEELEDLRPKAYPGVSEGQQEAHQELLRLQEVLA